MKWSLKIGEVRGIGIYVHATFLLIVVWAGFSGWSQTQTAAAVADNVAFILALFACIVLHELGHALTALRFGIRTKDITLLPIGGIARLERMPKEPLQELAVALGGPAVNVVIAAVLGAILVATGSWTEPSATAVMQIGFLERLAIVNGFLVLFNMLPAFPMDGGRALRALLATRMGALRATQTAASIGQVMALLFGFLGLFSNPFLVLIALFVWMGAAQEAAMAQAEALFGNIPVGRAMVREFHVLAPQDRLAQAVQYSLAGSQHDFPVVEGSSVVGVLTQGELIKGLADGGSDSLVSEAMHTEFATAEWSMTLEEAFKRLQTCQCRTLPVLHDGVLAGLLTRDNVQAFLNIQAALSAPHRADHTPPAQRPSSLPTSASRP
ncbi:MAG: CBS domain-containing protein [Acidobacteria bacterium]|nr:CBS domain-containing protein [Acidobacteriota bacterium]